MKFALTFAILAFSMAAYADRIQSKIDSIDISNKKGTPHLVKLENGRVVFIRSEDKVTLESFQQSLNSNETLDVEVSKNNDYLSAETVEGRERIEPTDVGDDSDGPNMSYSPTVVSEATASTIFRRMRRDYQNDSQCYNRAHVWANEEYKTSGLKSMKLFLFFTNRYIRNYRYKWWFHVSPMVSTTEGDRVIDRRYTSGPRAKNSWTPNFIYSGRQCAVVHKYSDYRNHQEEQDCYLIPVSMYFWQPRDIEYRDRTGYEKTSFNQSEVNYAYWEAF
jgi:hypothetical protein